AVPGDFQAGLTLTGQAGFVTTLGKATIRGDLSDAAWDVTNNAGPIYIGGDATDWDLNVHSNVGKVAAKYFTDVTVAVDGILGSIQGIAWNGGSVDVERLKYLKMFGTRTDTTDASGFNATLTVGAGGLGATLVKYGDYAGVTSEGNVGNTTVIGGDVVGSIISNAGKVGNILVKALAVFDAAGNAGSVVGGNFLGAALHGMGLAAKSIGNVTCIGGSFGADGSEVEVRGPGDMGKLQVRKFRYKESMVGRRNVYTYQGGGIWTDLSIFGRLGKLFAQGGDIDGSVAAIEGMGPVRAEGILLHRDGAISRTPYSATATDIIPAHLKASLWAAAAPLRTAIASITVIGGNILGALDVTGKVGNILTTAFAWWDAATETATFTGGGIESSTFQATRFAKITSGPRIFSADVVADTRIGPVAFKGSSVSGSLTAQDAIGAINYVRAYLNAGGLGKTNTGGIWDWTPPRGILFGGPVVLGIHLGQGGLGNPNATLGKVTTVGADGTLTGEVPFDPATVKIVSKELRYIDDYTVSPSNKLVPVHVTIGGGGTNGLVQV
ncbi:hypothetical protein HQ560_07480, partial [bacterium]|nr:hypothetical protein [bacterium]